MRKIISIISYSLLLITVLQASREDEQWFEAVGEGNLETVKKLVPLINVNVQNDIGKTALMLAAIKDHSDVVKYLLRVPGIDPNIQDGGGWTALVWAINQNNENMVKLLLQAPHININDQDNSGFTPLIRASWQGDENMVKLLLRIPGINLNLQTKIDFTCYWRGSTALMVAAQKGYDAVVNLLLNAGADANLKNADGKTALICAVIYKHKKVVERLLQYPHININAQDRAEETALMHAVDWSLEDIVKLLLEAGADLTLKRYDGKTALGLAQPHFRPTLEKLIKEIKQQRPISALSNELYWLSNVHKTF